MQALIVINVENLSLVCLVQVLKSTYWGYCRNSSLQLHSERDGDRRSSPSPHTPDDQVSRAAAACPVYSLGRSPERPGGAGRPGGR